MKVQSHHGNTHTEETEGNPHLARSHKCHTPAGFGYIDNYETQSLSFLSIRCDFIPSPTYIRDD